ncbi:MAG: hypothetical protein J3K34DRAFT_204331 [Monoraphidium minutum]|nr:MAG: hypothetical protein J3K34DRAFT_204331 [Monoraphidium minutum]
MELPAFAPAPCGEPSAFSAHSARSAAFSSSTATKCRSPFAGLPPSFLVSRPHTQAAAAAAAGGLQQQWAAGQPPAAKRMRPSGGEDLLLGSPFYAAYAGGHLGPASSWQQPGACNPQAGAGADALAAAASHVGSAPALPGSAPQRQPWHAQAGAQLQAVAEMTHNQPAAAATWQPVPSVWHQDSADTALTQHMSYQRQQQQQQQQHAAACAPAPGRGQSSFTMSASSGLGGARGAPPLGAPLGSLPSFHSGFTGAAGLLLPTASYISSGAAAPPGTLASPTPSVTSVARTLGCKTYLKRLNVTKQMADHLLPCADGATADANTAAAAEAAAASGGYVTLFRVPVVLVDAGGGKHTVHYEGSLCSAQKHLRLTAGWPAFTRAAGAAVGDVVMFERRGAGRGGPLHVRVVRGAAAGPEAGGASYADAAGVTAPTALKHALLL